MLSADGCCFLASGASLDTVPLARRKPWGRGANTAFNPHERASAMLCARPKAAFPLSTRRRHSAWIQSWVGKWPGWFSAVLLYDIRFN